MTTLALRLCSTTESDRCPHCGDAITRTATPQVNGWPSRPSPVFRAHVKACAPRTEAARAYRRRTGRWPKWR